MDKDIRRKLENILGSHGLLTDPQDLSPYSRDASAVTSTPSAVLFPQTIAQIAHIVRLAYDERLPISIRGGGTGLDGGAVATRGELLVSLARMNRITEISPEDMVAVVQPGLSADQLNAQLGSLGLFYPVDPAGQSLSTLGGDVATRAHSLRAMRYGPMGQYLLGLKVVISPGEIISCGARTLKFATGYHLTDLFAGSRGRLGIIAEIILKLIPRPQLQAFLAATLEDLGQAMHLKKTLAKAGISASRLELIAPPISLLGFGHLASEIQREKFLLLMELDGLESVTRQDLTTTNELFRSAGALAIVQTDDQKQADEWWRARGRLPALFAAGGKAAILATVVMPEQHIASFVTKTNEIGQETSMASTFYGHLGENRWHLVVQPFQNEKDAHERLSAVVRRLGDVCGSLHGQFLRPYALGFLPTGSLASPEDSGQGRLWRTLKTRFDPLDIFKPME